MPKLIGLRFKGPAYFLLRGGEGLTNRAYEQDLGTSSEQES